MNYNELITSIFQVCIIPLLGVLISFFVKWVNAKSAELKAQTDNTLTKKYLDMLDKSISQAVIATTQTYVDTLKKQGKFDKEAQKEAFNKVYESVMLTLNEEAAAYLETAIGDLQEYIVNKIESDVRLTKTPDVNFENK